MSDNITDQRSSVVKRLVVLSIVMVLLIGLQPFLWRWVKNRSTALHELRIQAQQVEEVRTRTKQMQDSYEDQKVFVAQLDSVVPQSRNALQVIERLETATQGLNVQLQVTRIDEGAELKPGEVSTINAGEPQAQTTQDKKAADSGLGNHVFPLFITVNATGKAESLVEYIDAVEHVQELSAIQKFTLSPGAAKTGSEIEAEEGFQLLMTVVFYLQGNPDGSIK